MRVPRPARLIEVPGADHADPLPREAAGQLASGMDWLLSQAAGPPRPQAAYSPDMLTPEQARRPAGEWAAAWNAP